MGVKTAEIAETQNTLKFTAHIFNISKVRVDISIYLNIIEGQSRKKQ